MRRTTGELAQFLGGRLEGRSEETIESIADLDVAGRGDLSYAEPRFRDRIPTSEASCILVSEGTYPTKTTIVVENPKVAFVRAAAWLLPIERPEAGVHPTAVIGQDVELAEGVTVGAHVVLEDGVQVGTYTAIRPGCYIARACRIGAECVIHANVVIYPGAQIGNRVVLHAGTVVGSDGFGYVRDGQTLLKFPQRGTLVIEDDVEIGANTTIDRGSLGETIIESDAKLDNLCHIGHNVRVGQRTVIAAQTGVSGSCSIGADSMIGGQVGVGEGARIDEGSIIGGQSGVLNGKRARAGEVLWGTPARPLREVKLQQAHVARLPKLAKEVELLRRAIEELQGR
jgi:UDP-3-O-[3-hydroxymyristoyl] glucosamine N-acyltransferase